MIRSVLNWLLYEWGYARSIVGNEGGFVHKSFIGKFIGGAIKTAIPVASQIVSGFQEVKSFLGGQKEVGRQLKFGNGTALTMPRCPPGTVSTRSGCVPSGQRIVGPPPPTFVHPQDQGPCLPPLIRGPSGLCIAPTSPLGASRLVGEATMGRYGAALIPGSQIVDRATCLRGMQLGNDGLCYNKGQITNKQRMWPAGRKPLLTGGQMNAISIAARAAKRLEVTTKRLQRMGMMKKPASRRATPAGHRAQLVHASEH